MENSEQTKEEKHFSFPIVENEKIRRFDSRPKPQEEKITHFLLKQDEKEKHGFALLKTVGGLHYVFQLKEMYYGNGIYTIDFKTTEFEYARTSLDEQSRALLAETVAKFIEDVFIYTQGDMKEIHVEPAPASYTADEVNRCADEILAFPKMTQKRDELLAQYQGFRIFDLYKEMFGKGFHEVHYNQTNKARERGRLFKIMAKQYLPDWEIQKEDNFFGSFVLRRKQ